MTIRKTNPSNNRFLKTKAKNKSTINKLKVKLKLPLSKYQNPPKMPINPTKYNKSTINTKKNSKIKNMQMMISKTKIILHLSKIHPKKPNKNLQSNLKSNHLLNHQKSPIKLPK